SGSVPLEIVPCHAEFSKAKCSCTGSFSFSRVFELPRARSGADLPGKNRQRRALHGLPLRIVLCWDGPRKLEECLSAGYVPDQPSSEDSGIDTAAGQPLQSLAVRRAVLDRDCGLASHLSLQHI